MPENSTTEAKPVYCPRRRQHNTECETPNACAGGADCRLGPDLNTRMNPTPEGIRRVDSILALGRASRPHCSHCGGIVYRSNCACSRCGQITILPEDEQL